MILLGFEDLTERRAKDRDLAELLQRKDTSLQEMQHRIANSLQIIASTLLITSRTECSAETRQHLLDVHHRIMSVAALQRQQLEAFRDLSDSSPARSIPGRAYVRPWPSPLIGESVDRISLASTCQRRHRIFK